MGWNIVRWFLFISVSSVVLGFLHYYLYLRLVRRPSWPKRVRQFLAGVAVALVIAMPTARIFYRFFPGSLATPLATAVLTWMGFSFLLSVFCFAGDILHLMTRGLNKIRQASFRGSKEVLNEDRRLFLARGFVAATTISTGTLGTKGILEAISDPQLQHVQIPIDVFPKGLKGYKILQISDLHVGPTIRRDYVERVVKLANSQVVDLVVLTGDIVDGDVPELENELAPLFDLKSKEGIYFITGNHDYYSGAEEWKSFFRNKGVKVLDNNLVVMGEGENAWELAGVDWFSDFDETFKNHDPEKACILLNHQPKGIHTAIEKGACLQLSGHTHGGQIWPFHYIVGLVQPYVSGLHRHEEGWIYVSRGTGYWGSAMRVGAPSEITIIEIV